MKIIIGLIFCVVLVVLIKFVLDYFSSSHQSRSVKKADKKSLAAVRRQNQLARATLIKIASNDAGNPALEAQLALEQMSNIELQELES